MDPTPLSALRVGETLHLFHILRRQAASPGWGKHRTVISDQQPAVSTTNSVLQLGYIYIYNQWSSFTTRHSSLTLFNLYLHHSIKIFKSNWSIHMLTSLQSANQPSNILGPNHPLWYPGDAGYLRAECCGPSKDRGCPVGARVVGPCAHGVTALFAGCSLPQFPVIILIFRNHWDLKHILSARV